MTQNDSETFLQQSQALIPADVYMLSGCEDEQTSADVSNHNNGSSALPHPKGRASGAATSALLEILYSNQTSKLLTFQQVLVQLRDKLQQQGHSQIPQLTSSRPLDLKEAPFGLCQNSITSTTSSTTSTARHRALLVGINYHGQAPGELKGCHNDILHMQEYLLQHEEIPAEDILVLMDDGKHHAPTRTSIIRALQHLVAVSQPGDTVFFQYSGHGGLLSPDYNRYKQQLSSSLMSNPKKTNKHSGSRAKSMVASLCKEYDQTLIPVDHSKAGHIRDFSLFHHFVQPMAAGVSVVCLMDCCHSGSVLELPYTYLPTHTGRGFGSGSGTSSGGYVMHENMSLLSNLAFLYVLGGGTLPTGDLFQSVTDNLQATLGSNDNLQEYQGILQDALDQDTVDTGGWDDAAAAAGMDGGDVDNPGFFDGTLEDGEAGDGLDVGESNFMERGGDDGVMGGGGFDNDFVVPGEDVPTGFGGGFVDSNAFGGGNAYEAAGGGGGGFAAADMFGGDADTDGCGDEGCGDILSAIADCLNEDG